MVECVRLRMRVTSYIFVFIEVATLALQKTYEISVVGSGWGGRVEGVGWGGGVGGKKVVARGKVIDNQGGKQELSEFNSCLNFLF